MTDKERIEKLEKDVVFLKEQLLATVRVCKDMSKQQGQLATAVKILNRRY